jgi:hypothetical protein
VTPAERANVRKHGASAWDWLLLVPFVALLWLPFYAKFSPELWGFPFFYWYQFLWVPLSAVIIGWVYWKTR